MKPDRLMPTDAPKATTTRLVSNPARIGDMRMPMRRPQEMPTEAIAPQAVSEFIDSHYHHFNADSLKRAADAFSELIDGGGQMALSMAGAMSTARIGTTLAPMIRQGKIHALSVTGANLEEDLFRLVAHDHYESFPDYQDLTPADDIALAKRKINRVTDVGIPEPHAMTPIEQAITTIWKRADRDGTRLLPHEPLYQIARSGELKNHYEGDPANSWLVAAAEMNLPISVPGWEDSTLGNVCAAMVYAGELSEGVIRPGISYMKEAMAWYLKASKAHTMGFFQLGGGIAGDFLICVVPALRQDAKLTDTPLWQYFCQITDAQESYGGYSGALPSEKRSWGKLPAECPCFSINSDSGIVAPLIFAKVLGW